MDAIVNALNKIYTALKDLFSKNDDILDAIGDINLEIPAEKETLPILQGADGELYVRDQNLEKLFGSNPLNKNGQIKVINRNNDFSLNDKITGVNSEMRIDCDGFTTLTIQLSGTWAGTQTFEISANGADFIAIAGINAATNTIAYTTTASGIFRFNIAGLKYFRVRFSAYTSGIVMINMTASVGAQYQPFSQTTAGLVNTADAYTINLSPSQMYQTGFELGSIRITEPTINPTQPTTYAQNKFAKFPQQFRRVRVEIAGNQRQAIAQDELTGELLSKDKNVYRILEEILIAIKEQSLIN